MTRAHLEYRTERFSVRGLELAYHCFGDPSGSPIVMLHGFMDHGLAFVPAVGHLPPERFFVVAPDHRGHGMSGWVGDGGYYYFQDYFQDVTLLIEHLGFERFGMVGHSMGGSIATGVGALMPDRVEAMVLIEGMGPPFGDPADSVGRIRRWIDAVRGGRPERRRMGDLDEAVGRLMRINPRLSEEVARALAQTFTEPVEDGLVWRFDPLHRTPSPKAYLQAETEPMWRALTMPVLSLYGTETPFKLTDLGERHACLPNGLHLEVEGAGHNIHHERPELVASYVADWMTAAGRNKLTSR